MDRYNVDALVVQSRIREPSGRHFAQTVAAEQENLGVLDEPVGDGGGDGGVEQDVAPVGKRRVGCNDRRAFLAVASRDYLVEKVRSLLIESQVS